MPQPRFEIGLVMAGAISAGAYSAGVLDFLVEALDAWERAKATPEGPQHTTALKVVAGASAGSIAGAILAAALKYDFPHITRDSGAAQRAANPLFDSWVNRIDISHLLGSRDVEEGGKALSALDSTVLMEIARAAIDYEGAPIDRRGWLCGPLRFIFTLTNLRGVPYHYALGGSAALGMDMTRHGENMRFALEGIGQEPAQPVRANEYTLAYPAAGPKWPTWGSFALTAVASGAFPLGLSPRALERRTSDYRDEPVVVSGAVRPINPSWTPDINPDPGPVYRFVTVDGGTIENEPLNLARVELFDNDPLAMNEPDGVKETRAVLLIDPFTGPDTPGPQTLEDSDLVGLGFRLLGSLKNQARYNPVDIALATDESIYSRFLIAPVRPGADAGNSAYAIACGSLGGFGGFLSRSYREHDFFLGRRNCQRFLQKHFTLPEGNPLFANWTLEQKIRHRVAGAQGGELPIVPLMASVHPDSYEQQAAPWPMDAVDPEALEDPVCDRLDTLYDGVVSTWGGFLLGIGWRLYVRPMIRDYVIEEIRKGLVEHKLLGPA